MTSAEEIIDTLLYEEIGNIHLSKEMVALYTFNVIASLIAYGNSLLMVVLLPF